MTMSGRGRWAGLVVLFCAVLMCSENLSAQNAGGYLPSESPEKIQPVTDSFDFVKTGCDDPDERRGEVAHRHRSSERREECADPVDPNSV